MTAMKSMGRRFRDLLEGPGVTIAPGAMDVLSARIFEDVGFKMLWAGGFMSSASQIGWADTNVLSLSEHVGYVKNMRQCTDLPIFVDADNGYGNAVNVIRTVREFEAAGVGGIMLEDQVLPKRCALFPGQRPIVSTAEMVGKLHAAVDARRDPDVVIVARTDSFGAGLSVDEALERAQAYVAAGADAILPISKQWANLESFARKAALGVPLITGPTLFPQITTAFLDTIGYKIMIQPLAPTRIAVKAIKDAMEILLREGTPINIEERMCTFDELKQLVRLDEVARWEKKYLPEGTSLEDSVAAR